MSVLRDLFLFAGLSACQFGGPSGDPSHYVPSPEAGDDGSVEVPSDDVTVVPIEGSSSAPVPDSSVDDGLESGSTADDADIDGGCNQTVAVCDPVHDTGCNPLQQCDVNPTQTTTPTGLCVFNGPSEAAVCTSSIVNESCAPGMACISGACRSLCFCDSDCHQGDCCTDTSGPAGFLLCQSCE